MHPLLDYDMYARHDVIIKSAWLWLKDVTSILEAGQVIAAAAIINALQSLVSRETSPTDSAVISVTRLSTGTFTMIEQIR